MLASDSPKMAFYQSGYVALLIVIQPILLNGGAIGPIMASMNIAPPGPEQIRATRKSAKLTSSAAAELVHVDARTWRRWENRERGMHPAFWELFLLKIASLKDAAAPDPPCA